MKKHQVVLLSLLVLAAIVTVGCGGGSPSFSKLPFSSNRTVTPATPLFLMNLDGTNVTPVQYTLDNFYSPSISADLKKVAFVSYPNVWVMNSDGTGKTQLTTFDDPVNQDSSYTFYARISPNGKKVLYSIWDGTAHADSVWIMNVDGTSKKNLTVTFPTGMVGCYSGSFSADSHKVTFACYGNSADGIYVADLDGSHLKTVVPATQGTYFDIPMFSPDGKKILFIGFGYTVGGGVRSNVIFSPKPTFTSVRTGSHSHLYPRETNNQGIFSINIDGSGGTLVVPNVYEAEILNSTLYYTLYDSDISHNQIWKSNIDGSGAVKLSDGTADDWLALGSE